MKVNKTKIIKLYYERWNIDRNFLLVLWTIFLWFCKGLKNFITNNFTHWEFDLTRSTPFRLHSIMIERLKFELNLILVTSSISKAENLVVYFFHSSQVVLVSAALTRLYSCNSRDLKSKTFKSLFKLEIKLKSELWGFNFVFIFRRWEILIYIYLVVWNFHW